MNLFSLIYSSSLIYPKDEEKRRDVSHWRLPEVLRKFKTGPCVTFQVSAPRGSLMPRQHAQREHRTRCPGLTEEKKGTANSGSPPSRRWEEHWSHAPAPSLHKRLPAWPPPDLQAGTSPAQPLTPQQHHHQQGFMLRQLRLLTCQKT